MKHFIQKASNFNTEFKTFLGLRKNVVICFVKVAIVGRHKSLLYDRKYPHVIAVLARPFCRSFQMFNSRVSPKTLHEI
jgi:hypothetical protein